MTVLWIHYFHFSRLAFFHLKDYSPTICTQRAASNIGIAASAAWQRQVFLKQSKVMLVYTN
jgi:hypothetical protein